MLNSILETVITVVVTAVVTASITAFVTTKKKMKSLLKSQCSQLRIQILELADKCLEKNSITYEELDALTKAYNDYHALGGNGTITKVYEEVSSLHLDTKHHNN